MSVGAYSCRCAGGGSRGGLDQAKSGLRNGTLVAVVLVLRWCLFRMDRDFASHSQVCTLWGRGEKASGAGAPAVAVAPSVARAWNPELVVVRRYRRCACR